MPAAPGTKRVKGVSIYRPFVYGSISVPIPDDNRPPNIPPEHTHKWTVYIRGINNEDISYWLKKVQFKLHETYANSLRTVEGPPFEVSESGWGEFEIQMKLYFVPESMEKSQTLWHTLKLHPWGPDAERIKRNGDPVTSQAYDEIIFNEPVEQFYELLTGGPSQSISTPTSAHTPHFPSHRGKGKGKHSSHANTPTSAVANTRTAEIPEYDSPNNPYSQQTELKELDRLAQALKLIDRMIKEERKALQAQEKLLDELRKSEGKMSATDKKKK